MLVRWLVIKLLVHRPLEVPYSVESHGKESPKQRNRELSDSRHRHRHHLDLLADSYICAG